MSEIDVEFKSAGSFWLARVLTPEAEDWIDQHVVGDMTRWDGALVVESRYVEDLNRGMQAAGLVTLRVD